MITIFNCLRYFKQINEERRSSFLSSAKSLVKNSNKKLIISPAKSYLYEDHSIKKKKKKKSKSSNRKYTDLETLKHFFEKKNKEKLQKNIQKDNIKNHSKSKSISTKNINDLNNKLISFKSIIINNINNTEKNTNNKSSKRNSKISENEKYSSNKKIENNIFEQKDEIKEKSAEKKIKRFFCCL